MKYRIKNIIDWNKLYNLLEEVTPLPVDCGQLCDSVCCTEWTDGVGMYLYPGEEVMFSQEESWLVWEKHYASKHQFCPNWQGSMYFIRCFGSCPRSKRPLACRTFPLSPYVSVTGELQIKFNQDAWLICPLVKAGDYKLLDKKFIRQVRLVWEKLIKNPVILKHVQYRSRILDSEKEEPWQKLLKG